MCKSYRPRQAKASPLYQCLKASAPDFYRLYPEKYEATLGPLRPDLEDAFQQFLRCGDLTQGFMRVRCEHCEHEYLLPFTCKQRGICPTCHQRRTLDTAENIVSEICVPVPHRHWVFAIPRVLRNAFRKDPKRLSVLCKVVVQLLSDWIREQSGLPDGKVGIILAIHSFGDYLAFHPHIHIIATAGVFDGNGTFQLTPIGDLPSLKELFRHALLKALLDHHWTSQRQVTKLLGWRNSGFQIDAGEAAIGADNERARRQLSEYLLRAPLSLQKMSWNGTTKTVLYRSSRSWKTKRNFEVYSGPDFIAALSEHIPPKSFQTIRYYGYYSNKSRGMRKKARTTCSTPPSNDSKSASITSKNLSRRKRMWRTRIMDIWGYDPLLCPCCRGSMKVISTIQTLGAIRDVLVPLGLWEPPELRSVRAPRAPPSTVRWMVDALDGTVIDLESETARALMPDSRRFDPHHERHSQFRSSQISNQEFEIKRSVAAGSIQLDNNLLLVLEDTDPFPYDSEPIFWTD